MINLVIAMIVSDLKKLQDDACLQALINKAMHIVYLDSMIRISSNFLPNFFIRKFQLKEEIVEVCAHSFCR